MPVRAPSICGYCGKVHPPGEHCVTVRRMMQERKARFDKTRPGTSKRGYDKEWERAARAFLCLPENELCARCGAPATVVMHVKSIRTRPDLRMDRSNWRPGCRRCNAIEAVEERRTLERKPQ